MTEDTTTAAGLAPNAHALDIHHGLLAPSPTNPRKRFDAAALAELADSVAEHGVMQPLAARPNPLHQRGDGRPPYEIVCGERRWRACGLLIEAGRAYPGQGTVPALVRDYTDAQVLALQALENVQRQDLHPLEEADHYHLMVTHPRNPSTVAEVAQLIGKSTSYVQGRLNLRRLGSAAREAFLSGLLDFSKALRVSAMPAAQQPSIVQHITTWGGEPMGVRAAERFIVEQHTLLLRTAPWNMHDADLVPEAGSCADCTKRTERQPELFETVNDGDRCMDGTCWANKRQAQHEWVVRNAEAAGYVIARGDRAASIMRTDSTLPADGWHDLSARVPAHLGDSTLTVEQVIDRAAVAAEQITVLDQPSRGRLVQLVTTATLRTALKAIDAQKADPPPLELQGQQPATTKPGKAAAPAPAPAAGDGAPPRVAAKPAEPEATAWNPLDDLLAFDVLPGGQCNDALVERCRSLAIQRTVACLAVHRACGEVRDRGLQLNVLLPRELACAIASTLWMGFDFDDAELENLSDLARLAGIDSAPPMPRTTSHAVHRDAVLAWIHSMDRTDATCLAYALMRQDTVDKPGGHNWRHLASAMGIAPDPLLAEATTAVDERLRLELMARAPSAPPKAATKPPAKKAPAKKTTGPAIRYRDARTGDTWTGRGLQPKWLKAQIDNGALLADFEVLR